MSAHETEWKRLGDGSLLTEDADVGLGHIVSEKTYLSVFVSLLVLTVVTVLVATVDLGVFNLVVAIAIASVKAGIVTLFFMHLKWENKMMWGIVIYPIFIIALLIGGTLGDAALRVHDEPPQPSMGTVGKVVNH